MSLVTDKTLMALWKTVNAAVDSEWPSKTFWNQLLSKYIFPGKEFVVAQEEPPSSANSRNRIDIIVKYADVHQGISVLCFIESKRPNTYIALLEEAELQALNACVSYVHQNKTQYVYAMTTYGTRARQWIYNPSSDNLVPLDGNGSLSVSKDSYVEASTADAQKLRDGFLRMKNRPPFNIMSSGSQPFQATSDNLVSLKKLTDGEGKHYYSWKMRDGTILTEWVASSKWTQVTPLSGRTYFQNLEKGVWSRKCEGAVNSDGK